MLIAVTARSKVWVCDRLLAGTSGSNPCGVMDVCLLRMLYIDRYRSLCRADYPSRGLPPHVVFLRVIVASRLSGGPRLIRTLAPWKETEACCSVFA